MSDYELRFPEYFDEVEAEITAKGYFADLTILAAGRTIRPAFYDPVRLAQDMQDELAASGVFAERAIVVVDSVDRANIERAVAELAKGAFRGISSDE